MKTPLSLRGAVVALLHAALMVVLFAGHTTARADDNWTECADEGGVCVFQDSRLVRYGSITGGTPAFNTGVFSQSVNCTNATFGDPAENRPKKCWYATDQSTAAGGSGTTGSTSPPSTGGIPTLASIAGKRLNQGRMTASSGQIIENVHVTTTSGPCIVVPDGVNNVTIRDSEIGPCGSDSNVINSEGVFIVGGATNITIQRNVIHDISTGVFAAGAKHPIVVDRNMFYNLRGPYWQGQVVQFNNVREGTGASKVTCNLMDQRGSFPPYAIGGLSTEDHISMFHSKGLANAPIEIAYNRIRGPLSGGGRSGTGIQTGDGGQLDGGNYNIHHNTIVQTNGAGISFVVGGENVYIDSNTVDNRGESTTLTSWSYVIQKDSRFGCSNINLTNNKSTIAKGWAWDGGGNLTGVYTQGGCAFTNTGNDFNNAALTAKTPAQNWADALVSPTYDVCGATSAPAYALTQIFPAAAPTSISALQGKNIDINIRVFAQPLPDLSKLTVHLFDQTTHADTGQVLHNDFWLMPSTTWNGYLQFAWKLNVGAGVPAANYDIGINFYQGTGQPYKPYFDLAQCNSTTQMTGNDGGRYCKVATLTVTASSATGDFDLTSSPPPGAFGVRNIGVPWAP